MTQPVIDVQDLHKHYGDVYAVRGVSFRVEPGEIFAVLGPNGAGKTTIMRITLGLIQADQGSACLFGQPVTPDLYRRIGYLPEERGLYQDVTVLDCLSYLASLKGLAPAEARRRALAGLERVELPQVAKEKVKTLSKGMQQKVQFLATILHEPELIIVDEPFSGLDPINTRMIEGLIRELAAGGTAVVMSTHQMRQVEEMAGRLMMISRGQRVLYGPVHEVRQQYATGSVLVRAEGDLAAVPGVAHVQPSGAGFELHLQPGVTPQALLHQLVTTPGLRVDAFQVTTPSLDDIFVQVVGVQDGEGVVL